MTDRICVFCGSRPGADPAYAEAAEQLGRLLVARGFGLVYGGGHVGLMGVVADAVLDAGGEVTGIIPRHLDDVEIAHAGVTDLHVVGTMHERKAMMAERSVGFVALPGGFGTLEELFEVVTWAQLGIHDKPVGLLDVGGFYRPLLEFLDQAVEQGFVRPQHRALLHRSDDPEQLLDAVLAARPSPDTAAEVPWPDGA